MDIPATLEEPATQLAQQLLAYHGETSTYSHMQWLVRETAKLMARDMELTRRERELERREGASGRRRNRRGAGGTGKGGAPGAM